MTGQAVDLPGQIFEGLHLRFSPVKSSGICMFAVGPTSVSAQFAADVSYRSGFRAMFAPDGRIPGWLADGTDAVIISYSGNTKKLLDVYSELKEHGCRVHCITSGGELASLCRRNGDHLITLPPNFTTHSAVGIEIGILAGLLESLGAPYMRNALESALPNVSEYRRSLMENPSLTIRISDRLEDRVPSIYSKIDVVAAAKRWKLAFDKNVGVPSFYGYLPEFDHNEIVGWADPNVHANSMEIVVLRIKSGVPEFEYTVDSMMEVLHENDRRVLEIDFDDDDMTAAELEAMVLADMVSEELGRRRRPNRCGRCP